MLAQARWGELALFYSFVTLIDVRYSVLNYWPIAFDSVSLCGFDVEREAHFWYRSVLFYSIPNGGPASMVWGVSSTYFRPTISLTSSSGPLFVL